MSQAYRNSTVSQAENPFLPANTLRALMVAIHKITPELAAYHVEKMTDADIDEHLRLYARSAAALKLLTRIRKEEPELWQKIREWAEREAESHV